MTELSSTSTTSLKQPRKVDKVPHAGPVHVLLKVRNENGETIAGHQQMAALKGSALLGKTGQPIGPAFRDDINRQIESGVKTFLFLTTREGWNGPYVTFRCVLRSISATVGAGKKGLIPAYYAFDTSDVTTWFEIANVERMTRDEMDKIVVLSSGRSIMSSISSSATVFRVGISATRV
jgi:hypothetical protein